MASFGASQAPLQAAEPNPLPYPSPLLEWEGQVGFGHPGGVDSSEVSRAEGAGPHVEAIGGVDPGGRRPAIAHHLKNPYEPSY